MHNVHSKRWVDNRYRYDKKNEKCTTYLFYVIALIKTQNIILLQDKKCVLAKTFSRTCGISTKNCLLFT